MKILPNIKFREGRVIVWRNSKSEYIIKSIKKNDVYITDGIPNLTWYFTKDNLLLQIEKGMLKIVR